MLNERMTKWRNMMKTNNECIYKELQIPDAKGLDVGFNKEMDRFLFITTYTVGYGEWDRIHFELINHPYFQFNFLLQSLKPLQLKNRMDAILRACISAQKSNKKKRVVLSETNNEKTNNDQPPNKKRKMN